MTPQQFFSLSHTKKLEVLAPIEHLAERFEPDYTILLFQMDGWWLELAYHRRLGPIHFSEVRTQAALKAYHHLPTTTISTAAFEPAFTAKKTNSEAKTGALGWMHLRAQQWLAAWW